MTITQRNSILMAREFKEDTLLIATTNKGKVKEIEVLLQQHPINLVSLDQYTCEEPEENGNSFQENAKIKAGYYGKHTGIPSLADDSGLVIPQLDGQPGIYSARWAGENKDFSLAMNIIKEKLFEKNGGEYHINDKAYFVCALTIYWPEDDHFETFEGQLHGKLQFPPIGENGFGYDPIFIPEGYTKTLAELEPSLKNSISHRQNAFQKLVNACFIKETVL